MPLNQRDQKRAILHARALTYEDVARELRSMSKMGVEIPQESVDFIVRLFEGRAKGLREDADSTFGNPVDGMTVDEFVRKYTQKRD